jgi:hypothetical protein
MGAADEVSREGRVGVCHSPLGSCATRSEPQRTLLIVLPASRREGKHPDERSHHQHNNHGGEDQHHDGHDVVARAEQLGDCEGSANHEDLRQRTVVLVQLTGERNERLHGSSSDSNEACLYSVKAFLKRRYFTSTKHVHYRTNIDFCQFIDPCRWRPAAFSAQPCSK